jgi:hypothetical protein
MFSGLRVDDGYLKWVSQQQRKTAGIKEKKKADPEKRLWIPRRMVEQRERVW